MASDLWRRSDAPYLILHEWPDGDSAVVFDRLSGDTHALGELGLALLAQISKRPATLLQLIDGLPLDPSDLGTERAATLVADELSRLQGIGLIEPA